MSGRTHRGQARPTSKAPEYESETTADPPTFAPVEGEPTLEVVLGPRPGQRLRLEKVVTVIGRGSSADLTLRAPGVSREHAKLVLGPGGITNLVDLGSTNGTFLNRGRIDVAVVREGDRIQLGAHLTLAFSRCVQSPTDESIPRLTPRQLEIARLAAVGSTNAEMARALDIATRTVASHLERIYDQLGIGSRAALTMWLVEHNLHGRPST